MKKYLKSPHIKHTVNPFIQQPVSPLLTSKSELKSEVVEKVGSDFTNQYIEVVSSEYNLGSAGQKALAMLFWTLGDPTSQNYQQNNVLLNRATAEKFVKTDESLRFSLNTFKRGIIELLDSGLIVKADSVSSYFVSPVIDPRIKRITITKIIEQ